MTNNETLSQNSEQVLGDIEAFKAGFENNTVSFASGRVAAATGYGEQAKGFSEVLKANNTLPPTPEYGVER